MQSMALFCDIRMLEYLPIAVLASKWFLSGLEAQYRFAKPWL